MARPIMIQGTMSNAGKSLLAAGLCRIFKQDGYRVAPFKSQNMALNSFITEEGLEMGRAQVVQAEAAGIRPSVHMNPILLKPTTDVGSQVIVGGVPVGNMSAREYFRYKKELIPYVKESYDRLAAEYDIIVIEGAGSPAEINLKSEDIVNMGLAKLVDAPVLLVGDIDRGGVFAQLYGTVKLLEPEEQQRIQGLIINKFRGDKTILDSGVTMIEELCQIPVVGVTPYLSVDLEDEDSLSEKLSRKSGNGLVDIAVIRLPRISNFTDFQVFSAMPQVTLRYVERVEELKTPDLVILPGTKSTVEDLLWMRQNGLEAAILKLAHKDVPIFGICGGFQMMGMTLTDELGVETRTEQGMVRGMELLPVKTVYEMEKTRTRMEGTFGAVSGIFSALSGKKMAGYEIHMGQSVWQESSDHGEKASPLTYLKEQYKRSEPVKVDGLSCGNRYGTYVHGIFDEKDVARTIAEALLKKKGLEGELSETFDYAEYKEQQYEALARQLREHLDMERIYQIMGLARCGQEQQTGGQDEV